MINLSTYYRLFLAGGIISVISFCLFCNANISGGGSEAGNAKITGVIIDKNGNPAANTIVTLIPSNYNPVTDRPVTDSFRDTTSANGVYHFVAAENLNYSIEAVQYTTGMRALLTDIPAGEDIDTFPQCILSVPGTIRILLPQDSTNDTGYIFVPGTTIKTKVNSSENFVLLDSIPSGTLPEISYCSNINETPLTIKRNVGVNPNDTTTISQNWNYSRKIVLNTSSSGANIEEDIYNFPVLIRLTSKTFDFNQTSPNGIDLRFSSLKGKIFPHQIELWDSKANLAVIWVKIDTILGNNSSQSILMHWGNPDVKNTIDRSEVFDTTDGFEGVWHLGENAADEFLDASANHFNGISPDTATPKQGIGIIGNCQSFDGVDDFIIMPNTALSRLNFSGDGYFTVSAWVYLESPDNLSQLVVAKGYDQYFLRFTYFPSDSPLWEFSQFTSANTWQACTTQALPRQWTLLTGVRAGNQHFLYLNGVLVDSTPNTYFSSELSRDSTQNITIGRFIELVTLPNDTTSNCYFNGMIDETRIERGARSSAWVKLCFMNQRQDDKLIEFPDNP